MRDYIEGLKRADNIGDFIIEHKRETFKLAAVALCIMTALMIFVYRGGDEMEIADTSATFDELSSDEASDTAATSPSAKATEDIYVDIGGAVESPMLAKLPAGSRVEDAVEMAGGLSADADISTINRAEMLVDGQKIYIPKKGEAVSVDISSGATTGSTNAAADSSGPAASSKVNINTADLTMLQTITGVGPATAQKIIDYRTQNGRFNAVEDLKNVSGIGDKTFEKMKDQVLV